MDVSRRKILKGLSASLLLSGLPSFALANAVKQNRNSDLVSKKVVWVCLRGALDGLHTVIPHNEKQLGELRPTLFNESLKGCFPLNSEFSFERCFTHFGFLVPAKAVTSCDCGRLRL